MKKLLGILVLGLWFSSPAHALKLVKCTQDEVYESAGLEDHYFNIDITNSAVAEVYVDKDGKKTIHAETKINNADETLIKSLGLEDKSDVMASYHEFIIDLENNTVQTFYIMEGFWEGARTEKVDQGIYKCEKEGGLSGSGYLDYWWALILIIAVTFFIYTQSGNRLKKIRKRR